MDINLFTKMLQDKHFTDYQKMQYKYGKDFYVFLKVLQSLYYKTLPLTDADGSQLVFIENHASVHQNTVKLLLQSQQNQYGIKAAENEIVATSAIESIDFSRDSVRRILKGFAPKDEQENRILGLKRGLEFIADTQNKINRENLYTLYRMTVGEYLPSEYQLQEGNFYRHDSVYVVSDRVEHVGFDYRKVPQCMDLLLNFAQADDDMNDLVKAAVLHFYFALVHPYFDGNGRMARLFHLWFLIQKGYRSALFMPFSSKIEKSRKAYYDAFSAISQNRQYSGITDITPFVLYFTEHVYNKMNEDVAPSDTLTAYQNTLTAGLVTEKETKLWQFVLSAYGTAEFSTKQLEKDFGDAAYATIRDFVRKFEKEGLLSAVSYGRRVKYKVAE